MDDELRALAEDEGVVLWGRVVNLHRALGLGLKYGANFGLTHLGRIGGALAGS